MDLSGAFIPVSEDQGMIDAVTSRRADNGKIRGYDLCMLCRSGYDRYSGRYEQHTTISGIIADEMAIGMINQKTTAVRLIPVIGKDVGDTARIWRTVRICTDHTGE